MKESTQRHAREGTAHGGEKMPLTELPFRLPGRIFRSPMPYGGYDPEGKIFPEFKEKNISVIVLLSDDEECLRKTGRDLRTLYKNEGFDVIYLPIPDFDVVSLRDLKQAVLETIGQARAGRNIVVHCYAGIGRTGLFAALLAREILGISGAASIEWVRSYLPGAVETQDQRDIILSDKQS
jgi:protein-tyrosine phosphatase